VSQPDSAAQAATAEPRFFPEFCFVAPEEVDEFDELFRGYRPNSSRLNPPSHTCRPGSSKPRLKES
jgi:hypothetical protein